MKTRNYSLEIIAAITMAIDHIGSVFFPSLLVLTLIGRISFPIFSYGIAKGYICTKDLKQYFLRLLILAFISQIPYFLVFNTFKLNIVFELACALVFIYSIDKKKYLLSLLTFCLAFFIPMGYGIYGLMMTLMFFYLNKKNAELLTMQFFLTTIYCWYYQYLWQMFALIGVLTIIYYPKDKFAILLNKNFLYWFYPGHLTLIYIIKLL